MADADEQYTNRSVEDGWQHVLTLPTRIVCEGRCVVSESSARDWNNMETERAV